MPQVLGCSGEIHNIWVRKTAVGGNTFVGYYPHCTSMWVKIDTSVGNQTTDDSTLTIADYTQMINAAMPLLVTAFIFAFLYRFILNR